MTENLKEREAQQNESKSHKKQQKALTRLTSVLEDFAYISVLQDVQAPNFIFVDVFECADALGGF